MEVELIRWAYTPMGAFGDLRTLEFTCRTVERPWLNNRPYESCIPCGRYPLVLSRFYRGGYPAYEIEGVPGRSRILIHIGNTMNNVIGCVAVGRGLGWIASPRGTTPVWAVTESTNTFDAFMQRMSGIRRTWITVRNLEGQGGCVTNLKAP